MKPSLKKKLVSVLKRRVLNYVLKISQLVFKEAKTEKELNLVFRLRYKIYLNENYIEPNKKGVFKDEYDLHSINFIVLKKNRPIGITRLVLNSKVGFPTENLFNFNRPKIPRNKLAEISRVAIDKEFKGREGLVMIGLVKMIYEYTEKLGLKYLYANMPEKLEKYCRSFGIKFIKLKELPPTKFNLHHRKLIGGYFKRRERKLEPYVLDVEENKKSLGL